MSGIQVDRWFEQGRQVLRLLGTFDGEAADHLLAQLSLEQERSIVIDVALVRGLDEVGVATLARLAESGDERRITLRGLTRHQHRILRHLGAALAALGTGSVL